MFIQQGNNKIRLQIAGDAICTININKKTIQDTYNMFVTTLEKIAKWKKPEFKILYEAERGEAGLMTLGDRIYVVSPGDKENDIEPVNYLGYGISQMADVETVFFVLAEEFATDLRDNLEAFSNIIVADPKNEDKLKTMTKLLQMAENIEKLKKLAIENYDVPEYVKGLLIDGKMERNNIWKTQTE